MSPQKIKEQDMRAYKMRKGGLKLREIGEFLGVTRQRAQQIIKQQSEYAQTDTNVEEEKPKKKEKPKPETVAEKYAKRYKATPTMETLTEIGAEFLQEFDASRNKTIMVEIPDLFGGGKRKVGIWPWRIFNDLNERWREFARLANEELDCVNVNAFEELIEHRYPVVYGTCLMARAGIISL